MAKFTKDAIIRSFVILLEKKNFEKITVKDIVDDCGINRKTFYYYFADIYDLAEYLLRSEVSKFSESITPEMHVEETMELFCDIIEKNKRVVMHSISFLGKNELEKFFDEILEKIFKAKLFSLVGNKKLTDDDAGIISRVIAFSFVGSVFVWINSGFRVSERENLKKVCLLLQGSIESMINKLSESE